MKVFLSAIEYVHGDPHKLSELDDDGSVDVAAFSADIDTYRVTEQEPWELATVVGRRSLARAVAPPDLMIYVSENDPDSTGSMGMIADRLGLGMTPYLAITGYHCGNLAPALQVILDAINSGRRERILLLLADRALPRGRIMDTGLSVLSDGAAACLVTRTRLETGGGQVMVDAVSTRVRVEPEPFVSEDRGILTTVALARDALADILDETGKQRDDFQHVIFGNYRVQSQQFLAAALGLRKKLLVGPVAELGHCFSADILVTLDRYLGNGMLQPGDRVLASATGQHSLSALSVVCL